MNKIIFIPGLLNTYHMWDEIRNALGEGYSTEILDTLQDDSIDVMAMRALQKYISDELIIVGFSMGGYVALNMVQRGNIKQVKGLVLVSTSARPESESSLQKRSALLDKLICGKAVFRGLRSYDVEKIISDDPKKNQTLIQKIIDMSKLFDTATYRQQLNAIITRPDQRPNLSRIICPTLILCGANDPITPPTYSEEMKQHIKNSELHIIPNCGHHLPMQKPKQFIQYFKRWLESLSL